MDEKTNYRCEAYYAICESVIAAIDTKAKRIRKLERKHQLQPASVGATRHKDCGAASRCASSTEVIR